MKLEDIGFYTLSDERALHASEYTNLYRCELLLTNRCNFNCPYCRNTGHTDISYDEAERVLKLWSMCGLKSIRFSGGEPTLYPHLRQLVTKAVSYNMKRIAISTNGSAPKVYYNDLLQEGVNDFSISLDACCASKANIMSGGKGAYFEKILSNIEYLSRHTYVTVGVVFTEDNRDEIEKTIYLASALGVADIRIISAAQENKKAHLDVPAVVLKKHPILKYRVDRYNNGLPVRGLSGTDCDKCYLSLDDMAISGGYHYPCIIYLREGGLPIGKVNNKMRSERKKWFDNHNSFNDIICRNNCLDVCVAYNNKAFLRRAKGEA